MTITYYYAFIFLVASFAFVNITWAGRLTLIVAPIMLIFLVSTGFDYDHYKHDYESGYFISSLPFFFTSYGLTAEPFYKVYSAFFRVTTSLDFEFFLAINFILCIYLYFIFTPLKSKLSKELNYSVIIFLLPIILPTIFYFSPRSSISFYLVLSGLFLLLKGRLFTSLFLSFLGVMIHSQYIPFAFFLYLTYAFTHVYIKTQNFSAYKILFIFGVLLIALFKLTPLLMGMLSSILSFLPSAGVAVSKLHYINSADQGFRVTSILSLVFYPALCLMLYANRNNFASKYQLNNLFVWKIIFFISICSVFGFSVNVAFYDTPHLSGRLGRFSDYFLFMFLLPLAISSVFSNKVLMFILLLFVVLAPVLYPTVYYIHGDLF